MRLTSNSPRDAEWVLASFERCEARDECSGSPEGAYQDARSCRRLHYWLDQGYEF